MTYILISGAITDECLNTIVSVSENKYELENYAKKYVEQNPGTQVHIFGWEIGYESKPTVTTGRLWHSGYLPPKPAETPTVQDVNHDSTN